MRGPAPRPRRATPTPRLALIVAPRGEGAAPVEEDGVKRHGRPRRGGPPPARAATFSRSPVVRSLHLDDAVGQALADDDDGRDADQLGVLELHAGRDLRPVVVEHAARPAASSSRPAARRRRRPRRPCRSRRCGRRPGATSRGQMMPELVVGVLGDRGDGAGDADAVGAHRDGDELAVLVEHLEAERLGERAAELEDVAHLDAAGDLERRAPQTGQGSPSRTSAASITPSPSKSRPATRSKTWLPASLAPVTQRVPSTTRGSSR